MADATGVCYTQSGDVKRYEHSQLWQPNDYKILVSYSSGSTPPDDPTPVSQYSINLSYGSKNDDGSYQCAYIKCHNIGQDITIYDKFPTPPKATKYHTYGYIGVRIKYGDIVKWHVGFTMAQLSSSFIFYTYIHIINSSGDAITEYVQCTIPYFDANNVGEFDYSGAEEINDAVNYNIVTCKTNEQGTGTGTTDEFENTCNIDFFPGVTKWDSRDGDNQYIRYRIYCACMNSNSVWNMLNAPWNSPNTINNLPTFAKIISSKISGAGTLSGNAFYANGYSKDTLKYMEVTMKGSNMSTNSFNSWEGIEVYCQDNHTLNPGTNTVGKYEVELLTYNRYGINAPRMRIKISITF